MNNITDSIPLGMYRKLLDSIHDGVYVTDRDRTIIYWSKGAERLTGFSADEVTGRSCSDNILVHVDEMGNCLCTGMCPLAHTIGDGKMREADVFLHHKDGHRIPVSVRTSPVEDSDGKIIGAVEIFSDNTVKMAAIELVRELHDLSITDELTGIGNRRYSEVSLLSKLDEMQESGWAFGTLLIDVDNFKAINDTYGHSIGDRALKVVSKTLNANLKGFDFVGRWGGDEFIAILANIRSSNALNDVAQKLRILVQNSFFETGRELLSTTVSIGGAVSKEKDSIESILDRADRALYESKNGGKNRVSIM